jgi:recombination protein RecA
MANAKEKKAAQTAAQKALDRFITDAEKTYGPGRYKLGAEPRKYEVISTGSIELDRALIVGGFVKGRTVEIWGPEGAGKTTLAIIACVQAQLDDPTKVVMYIDQEHRSDLQWMRSHGMDLKRAVIVQPEDAEEVADMVKDACRSGLFSMIVVDSIGAMIPAKEKNKDADQDTVGLQAKIVTRMVKIAAVEADLTDTVLIMLNQVRAAIGAYGKDTTTGGGYALKHGTTMKLYLRRSSEGAIKIGSGKREQQVGHRITVNVERNSVALAYRKAEFALLYVTTDQYGPMGIDTALEATDLGIEMGIIEQNGGWYTNKITGEKVQGKPAVTASFRANPSMAAEVRERAIEMLSHQVVDETSELSFDDEPEEVPSGSEGTPVATA